jgi:hypothetical protein
MLAAIRCLRRNAADHAGGAMIATLDTFRRLILNVISIDFPARSRPPQTHTNAPAKWWKLQQACGRDEIA